jgi:hypothetical protein
MLEIQHVIRALIIKALKALMGGKTGHQPNDRADKKAMLDKARHDAEALAYATMLRYQR